jgi:hypothetical protein
MMIAGTFKLANGTMAISEKDRKSVVLIPAGARVVVVDGDIEGDKLLKIRYKEQVLLIRPADFRDALALVTEPTTLRVIWIVPRCVLCILDANWKRRERR